jgi:hypothetical protein
VEAFHANLAKLQRAVVDHKAFYWQMIQGSGPKVRTVLPFESTCHPKPRNVTQAKCLTTLRDWCAAKPPAWQFAHLYTVCPHEMVQKDTARDATAEFLLTRPDFAWIGYSWMGCFPMDTNDPSKLRPRPSLWDMDYGGAPDGPCEETGENTGVFVRKYPKADVQWDCSTGTGDIRFH